jgi:hypothetical protein|tara:strand:+ start:1648 stop:2004 length:357 start_codon:yes stop_codon:yes gene_type:complete
MTNPIYASDEHRLTVEPYINSCKEFVKDIATKPKYNNYLDLLETIIEYHNGYGKGIRENNYYDWLMIIPINLSVATNGFFAGTESRNNRATIRAYKIVLEQILVETVDKIGLLETENE